MGTNAAAQVHAEAARDGCFTGHWGLNGTVPGMRYNLAGGYQVNAENTVGLSHCIRRYENLQTIASLESEVRDAAKALLDSPDHFGTLASGHYRKVNIGIAWDNYIVWLVQQFEADYVRFEQLPKLKGTKLGFSGQTVNGAKTGLGQSPLKVDIYYHPLGPLTRGQLASSYCLDVGEILGSLIPPAPPGYSYGNLAPMSHSYKRCFSPYNEPPTAEAPGTYREAKLAHTIGRIAPHLPEVSLVHFAVADKWDVDATSFSVSADIGDILDMKGPGVYQLVFWGNVSGETQVIADYWLFHEVEAPGGYGGR